MEPFPEGLNSKISQNATSNPFHAVADDQVIVIGWKVIFRELGDTHPMRVRDYVFAASADTFLSTFNSSYSGFNRYPWDDWGPEKTRLINDSIAYNPLVCFAYGSRFVVGTTTNDIDDHDDAIIGPVEAINTLVVYDRNISVHRQFSPDVTSQGPDLGSHVLGSILAQNAPTHVADFDVLLEEVVTSLPMSVTSRHGPFASVLGLMCDEEHIVFIEVCRRFVEGIFPLIIRSIESDGCF